MAGSATNPTSVHPNAGRPGGVIWCNSHTFLCTGRARHAGTHGLHGPVEYWKTRPGETIIVAAASGAVESVVRQIAKIKRCRGVGIAAGEQRCRFVKDELGFDACSIIASPS